MTDFTKTKMAFAVGLLAVLFMIKPLVDDFGRLGFGFLTVIIEVRFVYYAFAALLGSSAYCYALEMLTERSNPMATRTGNLLYALAMLVPPVYGALAIIYYIANGINLIIGVEGARHIVEGILMFLLGLLGILFFLSIRHRLREQDKLSVMDRLGAEQANLVTKASGLLEAGLYDLVLVEAFRAIETGLKKALTTRDVGYRNSAAGELILLAEQHKIIGDQEKAYLEDIRALRNAALHDGKSISRAQAEQIIDTTRRVITTLERPSVEK